MTLRTHGIIFYILISLSTFAAGAITITGSDAVIVIPDKANSWIRQSENTHAGYTGVIEASVGADEKAKAAILAEYFGKVTGQKPAIVNESDVPTGKIKIHVGMTCYVKKNVTGLSELIDDAFIIDTTNGQNIILAGATSWGTEFAVYEFLERYLDIRWLLPGPDGEDVPKAKTIAIQAERITQTPTFFSRLYSGIIRGDQMKWARRNRMHGQINFHHNFVNLFPLKKYGKKHPEFYPEKDGKRVVPEIGDIRWNICFSSQGVIDEAVKNICEYFKANPAAKSYSLGMNDSSLQCECAKCIACDAGKKTFLNENHLSDRYFKWANAVVERVLEKYPDKYFGMLAYHQFIEPPTKIKINEHIVPYFTYDRYRWVKDSAARQTDIKFTAEWAKAAPNLGWYDYFYGTPYAAPRVHFHKMAECYRFARDNNVSAMYGEAYPNFGEGPKLWLALKMQWDVDADVDVLLDDWYRRCVGEKAAGYLKEYFTMWEDIWATKIPDSPWWSDGGHYLAFYLPKYLEVITADDIDKTGELMEKVVANAKTEPQKKRAEALAKTFEYYQSTWELYTADQKSLNLGDPKKTTEAIGCIDRGVDLMEKADARYKMVKEEFEGDAILHQAISIDKMKEYTGTEWGSGWLWKSFDLASSGDARVLARLKSLAKEHSVAGVRKQADFMVKIAEGSLEKIDINGSFEKRDKSRPEGYTYWIKWGKGKISLSKDEVLEGETALLFEGIARGAAIGKLDIEPGSYAIACSYNCPEKVSKDAIVSISAKVLDKEGKELKKFDAVKIKPTEGKWSYIVNIIEVPEKAKMRDVTNMQLFIQADKFEPGEKIYFDQLKLYKL
jgi:hypothetical protein